MVVLNVLSFLSLILLILLNGQTDVPSRPLCSAPRSFQELHPRPAGRRAIRSRPARRRTTSSARRSRSTRTEKLERARFRLYRSQILQVNMRLKALAEIHTMHSFALLCNLNFLSKFCQKKGKLLTKNWDCRAVQRSALCRSRR